VVDLVCTSESDNESSSSYKRPNDKEEVYIPDSPQNSVQLGEASNSMKTYLQAQQYASSARAHSSPMLSPQQQQQLLQQQRQAMTTNMSPLHQTNGTSPHQQFMTLDHHRLAAAQAAALSNIAIRAGTQVITIPREAATHFTQTSLGQSGRITSNPGQASHQAHQRPIDPSMASLLDKEQRMHDQKLLQLDEAHDKLVENMVKNCEQIFANFEEYKKGEVQLQRQIEDVKNSVLTENFRRSDDNSIKEDSYNGLKADIHSLKKEISRKKAEQEQAMHNLKVIHSNELKKNYTSHFEFVTASKARHSSMLEKQRKDRVEREKNCAVACDHLLKKFIEYQEKITNLDELIKKSKYQQGLNFVLECRTSSEQTNLYILQKKKWLETQIEYLNTKLDKKDEFDSMLDQHLLDFKEIENRYDEGDDKADIDMIMLLRADKDRLHEQIAALKELIGKDINKDVDMSEEILVIDL